MSRILFALGAVLAGLAVAAGAYGAHAGAKYMSPESLVTYEKAVRYQMYHSLAMLAAGMASILWPGQAGFFSFAGVLFLSGIVLFSFSLYAISLLGLNVALITPFGGTAFILGWLVMAVGAWKAGG